MSFAKVLIEGFVTSKIEFKTLDNGLDLLKFSVSVPGRHENEPTTFVGVRVWGQKARMYGAIIEKGKYVQVEGSLKQTYRKYTDTGGEEKTYNSLDVVAYSVVLPRES